MREDKEYMQRKARKAEQFTNFPAVTSPIELMEFLITKGNLSRNKVKTLLTHRTIFVDKKIVSQYNFMLRPGMSVQMSKSHNQKEFRNSFIKIVYEDAYLIVVDKNAGLLSVGTEKQREMSALRIMNEYMQRSSKLRRVFIVNRLDKEASGLMIFAKDEKTKRNIQDNWKSLIKDYRYVTVLVGELKNDNGVVSSWMNDEGRVFVAQSDMLRKDEKAVTKYEKIKSANGYTIAELSVSQKNQIRLHMQHLGYPILGDTKFGHGEETISRMALHAFRIQMYHPVTGEKLIFETPYPMTFRRLLFSKEDN